jgi:hypothetical protein
MPRVRIVVEEDNGNPLPDTEQVYTLEGDCSTLNRIEAAVEMFRKQALPRLEQSLLDQAQAQFVRQEKKKGSAPQR